MKLSTDAQGLRYQILTGNTTVARDVCEHIRRGDVVGSSFSFQVRKQSLIEEKDGSFVIVLEDVDPRYASACRPAMTSATRW